ncbi:hypothetical protein Agub_g2575, partial [Astrephomene gubernaculifera]
LDENGFPDDKLLSASLDGVGWDNAGADDEEPSLSAYDAISLLCYRSGASIPSEWAGGEEGECDGSREGSEASSTVLEREGTIATSGDDVAEATPAMRRMGFSGWGCDAASTECVPVTPFSYGDLTVVDTGNMKARKIKFSDWMVLNQASPQSAGRAPDHDCWASKTGEEDEEVRTGSPDGTKAGGQCTVTQDDACTARVCGGSGANVASTADIATTSEGSCAHAKASRRGLVLGDRPQPEEATEGSGGPGSPCKEAAVKAGPKEAAGEGCEEGAPVSPASSCGSIPLAPHAEVIKIKFADWEALQQDAKCAPGEVASDCASPDVSPVSSCESGESPAQDTAGSGWAEDNDKGLAMLPSPLPQAARPPTG